LAPISANSPSEAIGFTRVPLVSDSYVAEPDFDGRFFGNVTRHGLTGLLLSVLTSLGVGFLLVLIGSVLMTSQDVPAGSVVLSGVLVLTAAVVVGVVMGINRGMAAALIWAIDKAGVGRAAMARIAAAPAIRAISGRSVPLDEAEQALRSAVDWASNKARVRGTGFFLDRGRTYLYGQIQRATLAALRRSTGQVNVTTVLGEVGGRIDSLVSLSVRAYAAKWLGIGLGSVVGFGLLWPLLVIIAS
jgi:hypothetical protein